MNFRNAHFLHLANVLCTFNLDKAQLGFFVMQYKSLHNNKWPKLYEGRGSEVYHFIVQHKVKRTHVIKFILNYISRFMKRDLSSSDTQNAIFILPAFKLSVRLEGRDVLLRLNGQFCSPYCTLINQLTLFFYILP